MLPELEPGVRRHSALISSARAGITLLALTVTTASGQLTPTDIEYLQQQGQAEGWTFTVGPNPATTRTIESLCEMKPPPDWPAQAAASAMPCFESGQVALPAEYDWRDQGGCTAVRNQAGCGSCWAFATVGVLESAILIKDGITQDLSEQYLVSCNRSGWSCDGGWYAHDYHLDMAGQDGGIGAVLESAKPYTATDGTCAVPLNHVYVINSWAYVDGSVGVPSTDAIKQAILTYGPVSVCVYVDSAFQAYSGGIFNACTSSPINHAVVLVGWNDVDQAWILRNSWGSYWGEQGYMRIRYDCSRVGYAASYIDYGSSENGSAQITNPAPATTFAGQSVQFQWTTGIGATEYWLTIGDAVGTANVYSGSQGTNTSASISNLPAAGQALYVKLFSKIEGKWYGRTYTYNAANLEPVAAQMISPAPGAAFNASPVTFQWTAGAQVSEYSLWIGTTLGGYNLYKQSQGLNQSVSISNLPAGGQHLYVRLFSKIGGIWHKQDYTYISMSNPPDAAAMESPAHGTAFASSTVDFAWSEGLGVEQYALQIGTTPGGREVGKLMLGHSRAVTVAGVPTDGSTLHVRLWSYIDRAWQYRDYQYTAANLASGPADMTSPADGSTFTSHVVTLAWSPGIGVTEYRLNIGTGVGGYDLYNRSCGRSLSASVSGLPTDGAPIYVRLWSKIAGVWHKRDYTYAAATLVDQRADLTSPTDGSTLTSSLVTFTWSAGVGVTEYWLTVGKTGGVTIYSKSQGLGQTVTVPNLPTDGSGIWLRLFSRIRGGWQYRDYTFTAASPGTARPITAGK